MHPLILRLGLPVLILALLSWSGSIWYKGRIDDAYQRGITFQLEQNRLAAIAAAKEASKNAKAIKDSVVTKPIGDVDKLLSAFPLTEENGSRPFVPPWLDTHTYDGLGSEESFNNESGTQAGITEQQITTGSMDGNVREEPGDCPTVVVFDKDLDMYVPVECDNE